MRKLQRPASTAHQTFLQCIAGISEALLSRRMNESAPYIAAADAAYNQAATNANLHAFPRTEAVNTVTSKEMKALYKNHLSKSTGIARSIYDSIFNASPNGRCPLCGQGHVSTLDHHLPQSKYADLTVTPANLVPSCADCNKAKHSKHPTSQQEQTIHPYFDDYEEEQWLHAQLIEASPPSLRFYTNAPEEWPGVDAARISRHFEVFKLAARYTSNAGDELVGIRAQLAHLFTRGGAVAVRDHLIEQAQYRRQLHQNSWQTATYIALCQNVWFYSGGFLEIPENA